MAHEIPQSLIERVATGGSIVYPTSTLPALGCRPDSESLNELFELKRRALDQPVSLAVASLEQAEELVRVTEVERQFIDNFPQGSLTVLMRAHQPLDDRLGGANVAVRLVSNPYAKALLEAVGPLTATSANRSGIPCEDTCEAAGQALGLPAQAVLPGECRGGLPSTLVSLSHAEGGAGSPSAIVMREGVVPVQDVIAWSLMSS